jgi:hypothetical protein
VPFGRTFGPRPRPQPGESTPTRRRKGHSNYAKSFIASVHLLCLVEKYNLSGAECAANPHERALSMLVLLQILLVELST